MSKPDILIFLSDQHNALATGYAGHDLVETPNLDKMAAEGTSFEACYTTAPLCVPARMSMLTGRLPSSTSIFDNGGAIAEDEVTFLHSLAAGGYETVLCGRMHFKGEDQRHGFTKRIMEDVTVEMWGKRDDFGEELGLFNHTLGMDGCLDLIGGGNSPVLEYDRKVIKAALNYLDQDHKKPQCLVVGTYAPHFPYVAPPNLYEYYRGQVELPYTMKEDVNYSQPVIADKEQHQRNSVLSGTEEEVDEEVILSARAAYLGMITFLDRQIGKIKDKWEQYLDKKNGDGLFIYTSDHGDMGGEHDIFGKQTFYEGSARIPLLITGTGIKKDNIIHSPASIMDIGATLCNLTDSDPTPAREGKSLEQEIYKGSESEERFVLSEFVERYENQIVPGRMLRQGNWKLISYAGYEEHDLLFNLEKDPHELKNVIESYPEKAEALRKLMYKDWDIEEVKENYQEKKKHHQILNKWGQEVDYQEKERWHIPKKVLDIDENNFI